MESMFNDTDLTEEIIQDHESSQIPLASESLAVVNSEDDLSSSFTNSLRNYIAKEVSVLSQLNTRYRKLNRMHPYADEKMKLRDMVQKQLLRLILPVNKHNFSRYQELQKEIDSLKNTVKSYEEQINWQEEQMKLKDDSRKSLEEELDVYKSEKRMIPDLNKTIKEYEEKVKLQDERIKFLERELSAGVTIKPKDNPDDNRSNLEQIIKSQNENIVSMKKKVTDLTEIVKKQEMQIQFLETDVKFNDEAHSICSENAQRQEIKIQFLEVELNYRKDYEDYLKKDKEKLENKVNELTKSADSLKCENLSLNNILNEMKSSDGCSLNNDFCCETVKQVKLSFIDLIETEFECIICHGMFIEATITNCHHMFCKYCLEMWGKKSPNCPICRTFIKNNTKTTLIDNFIMNTAKMVCDKMLTDRKKALEERKQARYTARYKRLFRNYSSPHQTFSHSSIAKIEPVQLHCSVTHFLNEDNNDQFTDDEYGEIKEEKQFFFPETHIQEDIESIPSASGLGSNLPHFNKNSKINVIKSVEISRRHVNIHDKRVLCPFCDQEITNFSRHLLRKHKNEEEVKKIASYEKLSKERLSLIELLRKRGNFIDLARGKIRPVKRPKDHAELAEYTACLYCQGLYKKKFIYKHSKKCKFNKNSCI